MPTYKPPGPDDILEVWRGSNVNEKISGEWFTLDRPTAEFYANERADGTTKRKKTKGKMSPTVRKYYLPTEGREFFTDDALRKDFETWLWDRDFAHDLSQSLKYSNGRVPTTLAKYGDTIEDAYRGAFKARLDEIFMPGVGHPRYAFQDDIAEFLNDKRPGWSVTAFDEYDTLSSDKSAAARISYKTSTPGVARAVDDVLEAPSFPLVSKATAQAKASEVIELWRGTGGQEEASGQYLSASKSYAQRYANYWNGRDKAKVPTLTRYYIPKDGLVTWEDPALRYAYGQYKWGWPERSTLTPAKVESYEKKLAKIFLGPTHDPHYDHVKDISKFLDEKRPGWQTTKLWEGDGFDDASDVSFYTRTAGIAKRADDVVLAAPDTPVPKSVARSKTDDAIKVWRGATVDEGAKPGKWFTLDKDFAQGFADELPDDNAWRAGAQKGAVHAPNVKAYYIPREGLYEFSDSKLRNEFNEWIWTKEYADSYAKTVARNAKFPDSMRTGKVTNWEQHYRTLSEKRANEFFLASGKGAPRYLYEKEIVQFLNETHPDWKATAFDEYAAYAERSELARVSYRTNGDGVALLVDDAVTVPSAASFVELETAYPLQGNPLKDWVAKISKTDAQLVDNVLRDAWKEGSTISQATRNLGAVFAQTRNQTMAVVRTYYGHMAASARDQLWKANDDIVEGVTWDSILDNRTTMNICAPRDQLPYTMKGEPIGHSYPWLGGPGNAHWQCRSHSFPIVKGVERRVQRQAIGSGKDYKRGDNKTRSGRVRKKTRDSVDKGIYTDSTAKVGTNYETWLKQQSAAFQDDVLGAAKGKAFREGRFKLGDKFIAQKPTTISGTPVKVVKKTPFPGPPKPKQAPSVKKKPVPPKKTIPGATKPPGVKRGTPGKAAKPVPTATKPLKPKWAGTDMGRLSKAGFDEAPNAIQVQAAKATDRLKLKADAPVAHYTKGGSRIDVGASNQHLTTPTGAKSATLANKGLVRHEVGHAIDDRIGSDMMNTMNWRSKLKPGLQPPALNEMLNTYRSGFSDFQASMNIDAHELKLAASKIDPNTYTRIKRQMQNADGAKARLRLLEDAAKSADVDLDSFIKFAQRETGQYSEVYSGAGSMGGHMRLAQALKALELKDPAGFYNGLSDVHQFGHPKQDSLTYFSDMVGAATKNAVMPMGTFPGHTTAYYDRGKIFQSTEVFANLTTLYSHPDKLWTDLAKRFMPQTSKLYEEIIGL